MSRITFRVVSIELKDSTIHHISRYDLMRINITQRPTHHKQEYLLNNYNNLANINHEFIIEDRSNEVNKITLTLRYVRKSSYISGLADYNVPIKPEKKVKDKSIDKYISSGCNENRDDNVQCLYIEPKHSLIGYSNIQIKYLEVGVNNAMKVELLTRSDNQVVGYVNLEIYIYRYPVITPEQKAKTEAEPIFFVDPGCAPTNPQPVTF
ncbi:hypothetical protein M9Y10_014276 [Tritrichomonas musculus]|uniref:Uncharacterized protein n=1 Tax=Tritrichomonas musculus TaxID=1915356 RepID=A0ABR2KZ34_9EUKA